MCDGHAHTQYPVSLVSTPDNDWMTLRMTEALTEGAQGLVVDPPTVWNAPEKRGARTPERRSAFCGLTTGAGLQRLFWVLGEGSVLCRGLGAEQLHMSSVLVDSVLGEVALEGVRQRRGTAPTPMRQLRVPSSCAPSPTAGGRSGLPWVRCCVWVRTAV